MTNQAYADHILIHAKPYKEIFAARNELKPRRRISCHHQAMEIQLPQTNKQKPSRQVRAEGIAERFRTQLRKPLVIEFAGTPKSGKSTTIDQVRAFLKRCGFSVEVVVERASVCPIRDKRHASFNLWTAATSLAQLLEKTQDPPRHDDPDILILDRGIFDSVVWLRLLESLKRLTKQDREKVESFLLMERLRSRITAVIAMTVDSATALDREQGLLDVVASGSIMNAEVLERAKSQTLSSVQDMSDIFKILHIDTGSPGSSAKRTAEQVADFILELASKLIDEDVLHVERNVVTDAFKSVTMLDFDKASELVQTIRASCRYASRSVVEEDQAFVQPIPVAVIRNQKDEFLILKRRELQRNNHLHDKFVVWAGGHIREEDATNGDPILHCLCRELDEELRLSVGRDELRLLGAVYDPTTDKSKKHLAVVYEWRAPTDDVAITLTAAEFRERRGNSVSGTFRQLSDIPAALGTKGKLEPWSQLILTELYGLRQDSPQTKLPIDAFE